VRTTEDRALMAELNEATIEFFAKRAEEAT